jgi:DNA-binding SARP family transcriptional activator
MPTTMEFGLLGPLLVCHGGTVIPVQRGNQRVLLTTLLLSANRIVPAEEIAEALWGTRPPPSAPVTIRNYVRRLRQALGEPGRARITTQPRGYMINVSAGELDISRFAALLESAGAAARGNCWDTAADQARAALALWRGEPLADVESDALALREIPRLAELRLQVLEIRINADLHLGRHAEVTAELQDLTRAHPLREQIHALLMLALYRCGRQGEALAAYQRVRQVLAEELGIEPGTDLQVLHQQILTVDPALAVRSGDLPGMAGGAGPAVPRQLPGVAAHFTGRKKELAELSTALDQVGEQEPGTVVISAIGGMAGVGKTALAVYWAHQAAHRFGDGQLYVNLRGFDPSGTPVTPVEAIRGFLDALGVPSGQVLADPAAQAGQYRSLLAGRRMLIVLDNARDEQQVRPLLPATSGCLVIITSRRQLTGLAAVEGARLLTLDLPGRAEARQMLAFRLGGKRICAEPDAVDQIVSLCARLPLALAIAAARAATRPRLPLATLVTELRGTPGRLDALATDDPAASVRAVFSWSARQLAPAAARMFRLIGLHPGPDISVPAAASLAAIPPAAAGGILRELTAANLMTEHSPGRYVCHDLLRTYAAEQARATEDDGRAATERMLDHYLHTACAAALLLSPSRVPIILSPARAGVTLERLLDHQQAMGWFEAEYQILLAAVALAARTGFDLHAWQLPWAMADFLDRRGHWHDSAAVQRVALDSATRLCDIPGQAMAGRALGKAWAWLGHYDQARTHLAGSLALYQRLGDRGGQARVHQSLNWVAERQARYAEALGHAEQALALFQATADQAGQAAALNAVGWSYVLLGDPHKARTFCRQALALNTAHGNRRSEALTWDSIGYAEHRLGNFAEAAACYQRALSLPRVRRPLL